MIHIPPEIVAKWQMLADVLAESVGVPAALIMKYENATMEVFRSSMSEGNPYHAGDSEHWDGLYCQWVIQNNEKLLVPNALDDKHWCTNPDIELGMIAYLGLPIVWPDGQPFGTVCVLDTKENTFGPTCERLMVLLKDLLDTHLAMLFRNRELEEKNRQLQDCADEIRTLRGIIPICARCKKIRDDEGLWHAVEAYVSTHSEAVFSHGLCPSCAERDFASV